MNAMVYDALCVPTKPYKEEEKTQHRVKICCCDEPRKLDYSNQSVYINLRIQLRVKSVNEANFAIETHHGFY